MQKLFSQNFIKKWKKNHMNQVMVLSISTLVLGLLSFFHFSSNDADISALKNELLQPTLIYDQEDKLASKVTGNKTEGVPIDDVPEHMKNAVVAIEDRRFYEHGGVDLIGISRAFFKNIKAGGVVEGGSTITQQLTKNALLTSEKTYDRKLKEVFLALEIEKEYKKDEILQMYFNTIYFGDGAWGLKQASSKYFGKDVKELTIAESALLAGLIKAPSALNPYEHLEKAEKRRNVVLGQMKKQNKITNNQYETALKEKIQLSEGGGDPLRGKYPHYVDAILEEAIEKYGLSQKELLTGGYKIYTELNTDMQASVEKTFADDNLFPKGNDDTLVQSGAVLLDPKTGGVRALMGGRGKHVFRGYNRATQLSAQPGSTMKPIAVYSPALEEGWNITDTMKDEPMKFGDYEPKNYKGIFHGDVPMYEAVKESFNVPAVWLLNEIGIQKGIDSVKKFGIPLDQKDRNLALALGGLDRGVSPLIMAEAYSVFPNDGERQEAHAIRKIVNSEGKVVAKWKEETVEVTSKEVADKMTTMLLGVVEHGTGESAQIPGVEIAGKTGSTQLPIKGMDGVKDQWFVGYSTDLVGAVWVGYDQTDEKHYLTTTSSEGAAVIFKDFMSEAVKYSNSGSFNVPHIAAFIEQKKMEEERKKASYLQQQFQNETEEIRKAIKEEKKKWEKKWKGNGKGKGKGKKDKN